LAAGELSGQSGSVTAATDVRIGWTDLPDRVQHAVEEILHARVVEARSQPGGFSPGTADRVVTADGRRAFVKAAGLDLNPKTPGLHRQEAAVTAALPPQAPAPRLLGSYDDADWVALVLEDVDGRHPELPWQADEVKAALRMLEDLAVTCTPAPLPGLPDLRDQLADDFTRWPLLREDPPPDLDPWAAEHTGRLEELSTHGHAALAGDTIVHMDVRADNLLVRGDPDPRRGAGTGCASDRAG
jgi:hypothetical protein